MGEALSKVEVREDSGYQGLRELQALDKDCDLPRDGELPSIWDINTKTKKLFEVNDEVRNRLLLKPFRDPPLVIDVHTLSTKDKVRLKQSIPSIRCVASSSTRT